MTAKDLSWALSQNGYGQYIYIYIYNSVNPCITCTKQSGDEQKMMPIKTNMSQHFTSGHFERKKRTHLTAVGSRLIHYQNPDFSLITQFANSVSGFAN